MTFEEASSVAVNATAVLSAILEPWIIIGQVIYLMPVAASESGDGYSASIEVHVAADLAAKVKMEIIHAVQPIADTGVPVTLIWGGISLERPLVGTIH